MQGNFTIEQFTNFTYELLIQGYFILEHVIIVIQEPVMLATSFYNRTSQECNSRIVIITIMMQLSFTIALARTIIQELMMKRLSIYYIIEEVRICHL